MPTLFARRLGSLIMGSLPLLLAATAATAQIPCAYEVTAVIQGPWCGDIFGFPPTTGRAVTEDGAVVGHYTSCLIGPSEAFYWSESTGFVTLDRPPGYTSAGAWDIDTTSGWIVGAMTPQGTNRSTATLWIDGQAIDLGTLPGGNFSHARATDGQKIVGKWGNNVTGDPGLAAFLWEDGVMIDLSADLGTPSSQANDISDTTGQVVGWMGSALLQDTEGFIWDGGTVTALPNPRGMFGARANAISPNGEIAVGAAQLDDGSMFGLTRAVLWTNGEGIELGTLPGYTYSAALDATQIGLVIGRLWGGAPDTGFVYKDGVMLDLNELIIPDAGAEITIPWAVNPDGIITGQGHDQDGDVVALLLTPVDPPVGDLDGDCHVGILDLLNLLSEWGTCEGCPGDLDGDGSVGIIDLLTLLANWGCKEAMSDER